MKSKKEFIFRLLFMVLLETLAIEILIETLVPTLPLVIILLGAIFFMGITGWSVHECIIFYYYLSDIYVSKKKIITNYSTIIKKGKYKV